MPRVKQEEQQVREQLVNKCFVYLNDNFHKFKEAKKIRIAIDIIKKSLPQQMEHKGELSHNFFFKEMEKKAKEVKESGQG